MKFKDKVVLITGGAKGIGKAIVLEFDKQGANIIINYCSSEKEAKNLVDEVNKIGSSAIAIRADVAKPSEISQLIQQSIAKYGRVDILINNSGVQFPASPEDTTEEIWDKTIDINLKGMFFCIREVLPYMKKQGSGKIINISSMTAFVGSLVSVPYGVSKAGIVNMTKTLSKDLGKFNITVNSVAPGPTNTDLLHNLDQNIKDR